MKITVIGGGSYTWTFGFAREILNVADPSDVEIVLMDIDPKSLEHMHRAVSKLCQTRSSPVRVTQTTDLDGALEGSAFVLVSISVGGLKTMAPDLAIPEQYGIRHTVGDSVGPGGWSRAVRNVPVFRDIAQRMSRLCPDAWMLNYSNPLTVLTRVPGKCCGIKTIGMCPGVDATSRMLASLAGADVEADAPVFTVTGIDHGSWFTDLKCGDLDVLARLKEMGYCRSDDQLPSLPATDDPHIGAVPKSRAVFAAWRELGYMPAINDRHSTENWPWLLNRGEEELPFGIERTFIAGREDNYAIRKEWLEDYLNDKLTDKEVHAHGAGPLTHLIDALQGGTPVTFTANYRNEGQTPGFPDGAVLETRCRFDADGVHPLPSPMPDVLKTIVLPHVLRQELIVDIALDGTFDDLVALFTTDPLCSRLMLGECRGMVQKMLEANREYIQNPELLKFS